MSACEFLIKHKNASLTTEGRKQEDDEIKYGTAYRYKKRKEHEKRAIPLVKSPMNIPYKLCLVEQSEKQKEKKKHCKFSRKHRESPPRKKYTLLQLNTISQQKYMTYLSQPMKRSPPKTTFRPPSPKKYCQQFEFCSPRLEQLATPKKRRIFHTWQSHQEVLPVEAQIRFQKLLHTTQNIDPKTARCYFKRIDREKRKKQREKLRLKRKKELEKKQGNKRWQTQQIDKVANRIVEFFKKEPLFPLTYKQLLLSDAILTDVEKKKLHRKPSRQTKDPYKQGIIEIADKLAVWIDMVTQFVDVQAVDSDQDIPSIALSTIEMEEEEEEEESEYSSEEEESEAKEASIWGEGEEGEEREEGWGEGELEEETGEERGGVEEEEGKAEEEAEGEGEAEVETEGEGGEGEIDAETDEDHVAPEAEVEGEQDTGGEEDKGGEEGGEGKGEQETEEGVEAEAEAEAKVEEEPVQQEEEESPIVGEEEVIEGAVQGEGAGEENEGVPEQKEAEEEIKEVAEEEEIKEVAEEEEVKEVAEEEAEMEGEEEGESLKPEEEGEAEEEGESKGEGEEEEIVEEAPVEEKPAEKPEEKPVEEVRPPVPIEEHYPKLVCCLSLKTWAYWLLYITTNAHEWTSWIAEIIKQVRHFAKVLRGESRLPNGNIEIMNRKEWIKFVEDTEQKAKNWQKYSEHVKKLTDAIIEKYHNKKVKCCPKCVQENLIKNVTTAQETLQSLTDAMNNAGSWQKQLDVLIQATYRLTCNWAKPVKNVPPDESVGFEIEELDVNIYSTPHCSTFCPGRRKPY